MLRQPEACSHASVIRREASAGVPLNGLYCLDCGSLVARRKRAAGDDWQPVGPVMDIGYLKELRARLNWDRDPPGNIRLDPAAPGYAVRDDPKD